MLELPPLQQKRTKFKLWVKYSGTAYFVREGSKREIERLKTLGNAVFARRGVGHSYFSEEVREQS